jgi:hypothetical protein
MAEVMQRSSSLPDARASGAIKDKDERKPIARRGAALKGYLPLLDRSSFIYGIGYETCRRNDVLDSMERFRAEGDMPRLWAAVRRAKLDPHLEETPTVAEMARVLAGGTKQKVICENVARRLSQSAFATKDVRVLEKSVKEMESLALGPKVWKDPNHPLLPLVVALIPYLEKLRDLVQEHRAGCARFCSALLAVLETEELSFSPKLEVSLARWLLAFPDAAADLGALVSDDVKAEYWRLTDFIEGTENHTARPANLAPKDARLAELLSTAGEPGDQLVELS